jgi:hypothetical protein
MANDVCSSETSRVEDRELDTSGVWFVPIEVVDPHSQT